MRENFASAEDTSVMVSAGNTSSPDSFDVRASNSEMPALSEYMGTSSRVFGGSKVVMENLMPLLRDRW